MVNEIPQMCVITGPVIRQVLQNNRKAILDLVLETYLAHQKGDTVNPDSYFLRFPDNPKNRIIALPAHINDSSPVSGIKWIGSFPDNVRSGIPRASAVVILNEARTGYPFAFLEGASISSTRTAASAVLAAGLSSPNGKNISSLGFVGAGIIARTTLDAFIEDDWKIGVIKIADPDEKSSRSFAEYARNRVDCTVTSAPIPEDVLASDVVMFATNVSAPHVTRAGSFRPGQVVLNVSLRDISPELILECDNILDDVEHCMKADTSPHLAEKMTGNREFVTGTIADLASGSVELTHTRPVVVSPFGLGVLDLALARFVFEEASRAGLAIAIQDFFGETVRW